MGGRERVHCGQILFSNINIWEETTWNQGGTLEVQKRS